MCTDYVDIDPETGNSELTPYSFFRFSSRRRCILFYQLLSFQLSPELRRDFGLDGGVASENLLFTVGADHNAEAASGDAEN
jgi:hypothetical protein